MEKHVPIQRCLGPGSKTISGSCPADQDGCSAWGEARDEALSEVETAIGLWLEAAKEMGHQIPIPNHRYTHLRAEDLVERMK
jgi:predicted RNase H-like HicB family nuclease